MKKFIIFFLLFTTSIAYAKVNVIVSIAPQKSFVEEIGGDKVDVTLLAPIGANPNLYEPKVSQMIKVDKADIYFTIGGQFEKAWLPRIKNQNKDMEILNCSKTIERIPMKFNKKGKKLTNSKNIKKDIHVWVTPTNIEKIGKTIYETLVRYDVKNKEYYKKNHETFVKKAQETHLKINELLANTKDGTKFMVFHPAWGYFAKDYKLEQMAIEVEGKEPKPRELQEVLKKAKEINIKTILTQPEFSQQGAKIVAKELGINILGISPLNPNWSQNLINLASAISKD